MANHYSALKRLRQTKKRTVRNRAAKSQLRHSIRDLRLAIARSKDEGKALLPMTVSLIDKSVKKGIIKENTASRFKSRLTLRLRKSA